jgi:hypothetical protein
MLACSFSASTANIKIATLAKDPDGQQLTTVIAPTDTFYVVKEFANAPDYTKAKAVWTAVDVEGVEANHLIDQAEVTSGDGTINFKLTNNNQWPAGKYKVDLSLNDKLAQTLNFEVQ